MNAVLIVGLGNPGAAYEHTRHNVGYMVVDELCRRWHLRLEPGRGAYHLATGVIGGTTVHLVKPATFMNETGPAVVDALEHVGLTPDALLTVLDDFQLPLGSVRLRPSGSDGGHNGLASVIFTLRTDSFPRLRCGIGRELMPPKEERRDFVLSSFAQ